MRDVSVTIAALKPLSLQYQSYTAECAGLQQASVLGLTQRSSNNGLVTDDLEHNALSSIGHLGSEHHGLSAHSYTQADD